MSNSRRRSTPARRNQRRRSAPIRDFWGAEKPDDGEHTVIDRSDHPNALIESLGPPPFPGGAVAQHYFDAAYERAAALAFALAASAGLTAPNEPADDTDLAEM
jgi:hypothetical protein